MLCSQNAHVHPQGTLSGTAGDCTTFLCQVTWLSSIAVVLNGAALHRYKYMQTGLCSSCIQTLLGWHRCLTLCLKSKQTLLLSLPRKLCFYCCWSLCKKRTPITLLRISVWVTGEVTHTFHFDVLFTVFSEVCFLGWGKYQSRKYFILLLPKMFEVDTKFVLTSKRIGPVCAFQIR